jgi:hypothetical protein
MRTSSNPVCAVAHMSVAMGAICGGPSSACAPSYICSAALRVQAGWYVLVCAESNRPSPRLRVIIYQWSAVAISVVVGSRKEGKKPMISKVAAAGAVLALLIAVSGCNHTAPPPNLVPSPPSAAAPATPPAESQAATPSGSARSPGLAEETGREVGAILDDATITAKVMAALFQAPDVKGLDVKVETDKAVVQLSGFVANQAQIDKAVEVAKGVHGVREVQNKMSLKAG